VVVLATSLAAPSGVAAVLAHATMAGEDLTTLLAVLLQVRNLRAATRRSHATVKGAPTAAPARNHA
jgi:hypothetical protein